MRDFLRLVYRKLELSLGLRLLVPPKDYCFDTKSINCEVSALFSATDRCFPRARLQPPCPGKGYADVVRKGRF